MNGIGQARARLRAMALGAALALLPGMQAAAQDTPVVVELFTSQGCSSCPPADAFLAELAGHDGVIALALHVDYWDYIGWADRFAEPAFSARQKGYAYSGGWKTVYTPQVVINGIDHEVGSRREAVTALIEAHAKRPAQVALTLARSGGMLSIEAHAAGTPAGPADIHVVRYSPKEETAILRGENAGRTLTYTHVVQEWDVAARWDGLGTFSASVPVPEGAPIVVLVQAPDQGAILGAARLR